MPYSPVALVGLPFTAYMGSGKASNPRTSRELLSVVHEVGHIVFWKGYDLNAKAKFASALNRKYQRDDELWVSPWTADEATSAIPDAVLCVAR